jgi:hypothetical protein
MECEIYRYKSGNWVVVITPNDPRADMWDVWISGALVMPAAFDSPEAAAIAMNKHEFNNPNLRRRYATLHVSADLHQWHHDPCPVRGSIFQ